MTYAIGNVLDVPPTLAAGRFRCCVTSPPYWGLRDYGHADQLGLEPTPAEYVERMVRVFREVRRVLADDGTCWINIGDSYIGSAASGGAQRLGPDGDLDNQRNEVRLCKSGLPSKNLVGIPWRLAFALQSDGWFLRSDIIWAKPSPMPESVTDRPTRSHEYVFLLSKRPRYYYNARAVCEPAIWKGQRRRKREPVASAMPGAPSHVGLRHDEPNGTRNARSVWTIAATPFKGAHFAVMPPVLAERCIRAGSAVGDEVLDPFLGSGTVGMVCEALGRRWFGVELQPDYAPLIEQRTARGPLLRRAAP